MGSAEQVQRLERLRRQVDEMTQEKMRLEGQIDGHRRRLVELEQDCRRRFSVEIDGLPDMIEKCEREAEKALREVEDLIQSGQSASEPEAE